MNKKGFIVIGLLLSIVTGALSSLSYVHKNFVSKEYMALVVKHLEVIEADVKKLLKDNHH